MLIDGLQRTFRRRNPAYGSQMLEAQAHSNLKTLLRQDESNWPHHLTLSRLVGRSLRRGDRTLLRLPPSLGMSAAQRKKKMQRLRGRTGSGATARPP